MFSENQLIIIDLKIGHTSYKTYRNPASAGRSTLSICYHLLVEDPSKNERGEQILYAKIYLENRSHDHYEKIKEGPFVKPRFGQALTHLPELGMVIWAFPNDPVMTHLPECIDPEKVSKHLPYDKLPSGLDGSEDIDCIETEVIHYRPEIRCTSRYALKACKGSESNETVLFGKTFRDDQGIGLYQRSLALYRANQHDRDSFLIAQPLGYAGEIKTLWQAGLKGQALVDVLDNKNDEALIERVGKGLAHFHRSALTRPLRLTLADHLVEIRKKISKLIPVFPQFESSLKMIAQHLEKEGHQLGPAMDTLIHADFSLQQLLVCGEEIACFDFDEFAMGDPVQDIANFIVDCHFRTIDADCIPLIISTFLQAYERKAGIAICRQRLAWYTQLLFMTKAYRFYLQQKPNLACEIEWIIARTQDQIVRHQEAMR